MLICVHHTKLVECIDVHADLCFQVPKLSPFYLCLGHLLARTCFLSLIANKYKKAARNELHNDQPRVRAAHLKENAPCNISTYIIMFN